MSRNIGHVIFQTDGSIEYLIYNGTSEQCYSELYFSRDDAIDAFKEGSFGNESPFCICGSVEPVIIVPYDDVPVAPDSTIHWNGTACRKCQCIQTGLRNPWYKSW